MNASETLEKLQKLRSYDDILELVYGLGYDRVDEGRSISDWPQTQREHVYNLKVLANHGNFLVYYCEVDEQGMLTWERQSMANILASSPHSIVVFKAPDKSLWHFVHVRYDTVAERRKQLRRFVVDLTAPRGGERLRTTAERLSLLTIPANEIKSAPEVQDFCDKAFRVSEVSDNFLKVFVDVVGKLTDTMAQSNPNLLGDESLRLRQCQLLMDRLLFLYFIQRKGWLNGELDYLYSRFLNHFKKDPTGDSYYREILLPVFKALSHKNSVRPKDILGNSEAIPFLNGGLFDLPLAYGTATPSIDERLTISNESFYPCFFNFVLIDNLHGTLIAVVCILMGFIFIRSGIRFWNSVRKLKYICLLMAIVLYILRMVILSPTWDEGNARLPLLVINLLTAFESVNWMLAALGLASAFLNKRKKLLTYMTNAVYPMYMVHLPLQFYLSTLIFALPVAPFGKLVVLVILNVGACLISYEVIKRIRWVRVLFGMKP